MNVLHITNGDGAANIITASSVSGTVLPWRDPMHHGPCPAVGTLRELSRIRIHYLESADQSEPSGLPDEPHGFTDRDAMLERSHEFDEVVLWFEHDLLDQLQLLQLLDWYSQHAKSNLTLSLICIDRFPGVNNFRGIGQLSATQMASLYAQRLPVTQAHFEVAVKYWQAFCHNEPEPLLNLCQAADAKDQLLPFLRPAISRHLQEFPWLSDGLTRTERQILQLVDSGIVHPVNIFTKNMDLETHLYIGDWRSYAHIHQLCQMERPLLACANYSQFEYPPVAQYSREQFNEQKLLVTERGQQVLAGKKSVLNSLRRNSWLGGVHLDSEKGLWCWDQKQAQLNKVAKSLS